MSETENALVDENWLVSKLNDASVRIIEVDVSPASHNEWHIPGATLWNIYSEIKNENYHLRSDDELQEMIQKSGMTDESTIVFYGYAPALGFWLMKYFGHKDIHILNINKEAWRNKELPTSSETNLISKSDYTIQNHNESIRESLNELKGSLENTEQTILDVRSEQEYNGERFWPSGGIPDGHKAGHVPGAVHHPADGVVKDDGSFMSEDELKKYFENVNLSNDKSLITYCTIGARAATVWFALYQLLGHQNSKVYDGSWAEWGTDNTTKIAK